MNASTILLHIIINIITNISKIKYEQKVLAIEESQYKLDFVGPVVAE